MKTNSELKESVAKLLQEADLWIRGFNIENIDVPQEVINKLPFSDEVKNSILIGEGQATTVKTIHAVRDANHKIVGEQLLDLVSQESTGTNRFFELAAPILDTLENGKVLYIDEFGTYLHPDMCQFIVSLFASKTNKKYAQLIVNTHDTSLMSRVGALRREDIIFVEKNYTEETVVTPLTNKSVRAGESFEKRYREGLYGAKPQLEIEE